jgi:predicted amidohydrolase YtcJ
MSELIFYNANVITMDRNFPKGELIAIGDDKILAVTSNEDIKEFKTKNSKIIDCKGKTVLPGFIDAHCHVYGLAESLISLNIVPNTNRTISNLQDEIRHYSKTIPPGSWIRGKRYNEFYLKEKRHLNRWDLDQALFDHPIKLTHCSGHAHVLNSLALQFVGISKESPDPPGGMIDRHLET